MRDYGTPRIDDHDSALSVSGASPTCPRQARRILVAYGAVQVTLAVVAASQPFPQSATVSIFMVFLGITTFTACLVRLRPSRSLGWWLIAASSLVLLAAHVSTAAVNGLDESAAVLHPSSNPFVEASFLLLAIGLAVLGRRGSGPAGIVDALDASMVAAGTLVLAWLLVADVVTPSQTGVSVATFLVPFGALAVFVTTVKLLMSTGPWTISLALLALAVAALLASTIDVVLPTVQTETVVGSRVSKVLWSAYGALLGAAALQPFLTRKPRPVRRLGTDLSISRIVMFGMIAVLVPLALAIERLYRPSTFDHTAAGVAGPTAAAAALLLLLVARLAVTARISDRRAEVLRLRTGDLAAAIGRQESLQHQLAYRATHDPLTGLANRAVLRERVESALNNTVDHEVAYAFLLLDLDGFKDINDTYGHPTGDELLTAVARRLETVTLADGLVARLGGDEFAMLFTVNDSTESVARAEQILAVIRPPFVIDGQELFVSASVGLVFSHPTQAPTTLADTLRDADLSLYAAKKAGKDRVVSFEPGLREARMERARITAGLHHALSRDELFLDYQIIVDLDTHAIFAVEALARWKSPGGEIISPDRFIPVAEATGMINPIGERVLKDACSTARRWYETYGTAVCVNVSARQLADPGFADMVVAALTDNAIPAVSLILELTESSLVDTSPQRPEIMQLRKLRALGVRIAIDDFGSGYSSLSSISKLPIDIVKLDRSFAHDPARTPEPNWAFTGAILQAISSLGVEAIAEGIETPEQSNMLRRLRCPYAQGYLFGRPEPAEVMDRVLAGPDPHVA